MYSVEKGEGITVRDRPARTLRKVKYPTDAPTKGLSTKGSKELALTRNNKSSTGMT